MATELNDHSARDHALLSASSAHRWLACPPSAVAAELYNDEGSEFAEEGTLAHEVAEQVARALVLEGKPHGIEPDPEKGITREMIECAEAYADFIQEKITSPNAVVLLEQKLDFSRWVPGGFGTGDCCILQDRKLTTIDFKFGMGVPVYAPGNPQLRLYGLGAYDLFEDVYDIDEVEMCIFQPRIDNVSEASEPVADLLGWGDEIKPVAVQASQGKGKHKAGEHCRFCPHAGRCKTLGKLCTETAKNLAGKTVKVEVMTEWEIAEVLALEAQLTMALKKIKAYAMNTLMGGGKISGYKLVEGKQGNRKWISELDACKALEEAGYSKEDITETKLLSPAQIEKALGKKKVAALMEELTHREPGNPTLAPETDKRPAYDRLAEAVKDFE